MNAKHVIAGLLAVLVILAGIAVLKPVQAESDNIVASGIQSLKNGKVKEDADGMLILKRYAFYLQEIARGNAYSKYVENQTSPVYDFQAFSNMIYKDNINKIVRNTLQGKDAFDGITGLFERAYLSEVDQKLDSYIVYLPTKYDPSKAYPLVVLLHGVGEAAYAPLNISAHANFLRACEQHEVIMIAPNGRNYLPHLSSYMNDGEKDVLQVIKLAEKAYNVDTKRVYLTGYSLGGYGTWHIGSKHHELFAAIAPMSGFGTKPFVENAAQHDWNLEAIDVSLLKNTPVYVWHGDHDDRIPVSEARDLVAALKNQGSNVKYEELKGVGHGAADYAYDGDMVIQWFLQYSK